MIGFRQARSIANLPLTSLEHALNDDELEISSSLTADIFVKSLSNRITVSFGVSFDSSSFNVYSKEVNGRSSIERACLNPVTSPYSSLFAAYKPDFWYWECVECMRRLSLTGLLVFMYPGSEKQVLLAMLICFFWMMIYLSVQPYLESSHSFFMISSQWGVLLQLYAVYLMINHSFDSLGAMVGGLAVAVSVIAFIV